MLVFIWFLGALTDALIAANKAALSVADINKVK
jgi:hypothetical protein